MKKILLPFLALGFLLAPAAAQAYEINYASVEDIAGEDVLLKYRTTEGYTFAICNMDGSCGELLYGENMDGNAPDIFPSIFAKSDYTKSVDGTLAVVEFANVGSKTYRALYAIAGDRYSYVDLLPYTGTAIRTSITYANDAVVFLSRSGVVTR